MGFFWNGGSEGGLEQGGEEWQDVMRDVLENRVKGTGGGPVRRH